MGGVRDHNSYHGDAETTEAVDGPTGPEVTDQACGQVREVPDEAAGRVAEVPGGAYELPEEVRCALEAGHEGNHMSLLQAWGEQEEWLVWSEPSVWSGQGCRAEGMTCLLPAGHEGRHHVILTDVVVDEGPFWCSDRADLATLRTASA
ncbi:MAG: hypothetical protein ACQSGP_08090 [Frankia sp.]